MNTMISSTLLVAVVVCGITYAINYCLAQLKRFKDINKLPGPPTWEVIRKTFGSGTNYEKYKYVSSLTKKYGPVVKLWIKPFDPAIVVADVEYFDKILMSKVHLTKTKMYHLLEPYMGNGLATTNNVNMWRKDRKACNTAFQHSTITSYLPMFTRHTDKFLETLKNHIGKVVDLQPLMHLYALDIIFETLTKQENSFQEDKDSLYLNARVDYFSILAKRLYSVFLANEFLFRFTKHFKVMRRALDVMKTYTNKIIQLQEDRLKGDNVQKSKLNLLDVLYSNNIQGEALSDQINTFIVGGHDTTAQAMCFILYELARYPAVQQRLYEEIISIVGNDKYAEITYNDLQNMKYVEAVVKEVIRIHTIVPFIERKLSEDTTIGGINYPKGTMFMIHLAGVHESEKYYKNADKFDPDRFMPENAHLLQKNTFVPFSIGPRDCIGKLFALLEVKYFVAKAMQKFKVKPVENHEMKFVNEIIIKSVTGTPVILEERT